MSNVVMLSDIQTEVQGKVVEYIQDFTEEVGINSSSTRRAYNDDIIQFVKFTLETDDNSLVENISLSDYVQMMNRKNMSKFRNELLVDRKLVAASIKRKFSSLKEFAKYINTLEKGYEINIQIFDVANKLKSIKNSYEVITLEEATQLINHIKMNERFDSLKKYFYCSLAFDTGIRAEALNKLTPSSFIRRENEVLIKGIDKGNKAYTKSISIQFYDDLNNGLQLYRLEKDENIFKFSEKNRHDMIDRAKKALGWENRNITFHSFKKGAVTYAYEVTKDIQIAKQVGSHSSINTTQMYLKDSEDTFKGAVSNGGLTQSTIDFEQYSKEELIAALSKLPKSTQITIDSMIERKNM